MRKIFLLLLASIVSVATWAATYNLDVTSYSWGGTGNKSATSSPLTISAYIQSKTYNNTGSTKVAYVSGTNYLTITSTSANITSITITGNTDDDSKTQSVNIDTSAVGGNGSTWNAYTTSAIGTFANRKSSPTEKTITFTYPQKYVRFKKASSNYISIGYITVNYTSGGSAPVISAMTATPATVCTGTNISLSCTASNSPTNYRWYRCSSASIADSTAIGSGATASLSYSTTGLAAGSYYFGVIAENASGKDTAVTASAVTVKTSITPTLSYEDVGGTTLAVGGSSSGSPTVSGNSGSGAVTYSVSPSGYATVHSSTGVVTGDHVGSATVTASVAASGNYCAGSATASFTITCAPITPSFDTDYSSTSLNVGANSSTPAIGKDGSSGAITWESSDKDVATVNSSGVVTPVAAGSATITATVAANGDYCEGSVSKNFTINAAACSPSISASPSSADYCKDDIATALSFTGSGHNAQKWQYYDGDSWEDIDGATNATYTPSTSATGSKQYRVVTTCDSYTTTATSSAATVTVKTSPNLTITLN